MLLDPMVFVGVDRPEDEGSKQRSELMVTQRQLMLSTALSER